MATTSKIRKHITPRPKGRQSFRDALAATNKQYQKTLAKLGK